MENANFAEATLNLPMKSIRISWVIHGFAVLHFAMAWFSAAADIPDSRLLTLMTILMTLIICVREKATLETTCLSFVLMNIGGYYLGMEVLRQMSYLTGNLLSPLTQSLSSLLTTEVLGWGLYALLHYTGSTFKIEEGDDDYWETRFKLVALFIAVVFVARYLMGTVVNNDLFSGNDMYAYFHRYLQNYLLLVLLLAANIFAIRRLLSWKGSRGWKIVLSAGLILVFSACASFTQVTGLPYRFHTQFGGMELLRQSVVALVVELLISVLVYLILQAVADRKRAKAERSEAHKAQFQYQNLKQQVNPHFLFNSLNTLDGLVLENRPEEASEYIHKLSGLYRYMLENEGAHLVSLGREMEYTELFIDLLKVRFPEGLAVELKVRDEDLARQVVPCAVQLLVENAVQHNSTASASPLHVTISSDGRVVCVENNLQPKKSRFSSHSVGQRYIRQQYKDVAGADIAIVPGENTYRVELPLL